MNRSGLARTRWATVGAAAVLVLGAGGVLTSSAADTATASSFVPITPCRLADTRPAPDNVGTRIAPIAAGESFVAQVTGTNGNCTIPTTATGVSMNITAIAPTAASFLTVWPTDQTRPLTANLNWSARQAPTPNAVTATLSSTGAISLYNLSGTVEVTIDIVGYYQPSTAGPSGPVGPQGPAGPQGTPTSDPANVITVAKSGGDYTSVASAIAAATPTSASNRFLIQVGPGTYTEPGGVTLKDYVDIEGAGEGITTIACACASTDNPVAIGTSATMRISGVNRPSEIRNLTVTNTGGISGTGTYATGIWVSNTTAGAVSLLHVTASTTGAAQYAVGTYLTQSSATLHDVTSAATTSNASGEATGVDITAAAPVLTNVAASATGGQLATGLRNWNGSAVVVGGTSTASGAAVNVGIENGGSNANLSVGHAAASATGGDEAVAVVNRGTSSTVSLSGVTATASGATDSAVVVANGATALVTIRDSSLSGGIAAISTFAGGSSRVVSSVLSGPVTGGGTTCVGAVNASYVLLNGNGSCP